MGVTVPSMRPLNFSQLEKGSFTWQRSTPGATRHFPPPKNSVAEGPSFTAKPTETVFPAISSAASLSSSHRYGSAPSTAKRLIYAMVLASFISFSDLPPFPAGQNGKIINRIVPRHKGRCVPRRVWSHVISAKKSPELLCD